MQLCPKKPVVGGRRKYSSQHTGRGLFLKVKDPKGEHYILHYYAAADCRITNIGTLFLRLYIIRLAFIGSNPEIIISLSNYNLPLGSKKLSKIPLNMASALIFKFHCGKIISTYVVSNPLTLILPCLARSVLSRQRACSDAN